MGAASYVGRVGGLAVALGVGSALFAGSGLAWADTTDSSTATSTTSATSDSDPSTDSGTTENSPQAAESDEADDQADADADTETEVEVEAEADVEDRSDADLEAGAEDPADAEVDADAQTDAQTDGEAEDQADPAVAPDTDNTPESESGSPSTPSTTKRSPEATADQSIAEPTEQESASKKSAPEKSTAETTKTSTDPAVAPQASKKVAVFANATTLAAASPATVSPKVAALLSRPSTPKPNLVTAVVNVVNSMLEWARQKADATPGSAPQPPFLWALLSFARRELENIFVPRSTVSAAQAALATPTSLALAVDGPTAAATAALVPYSPWLNPQVSESTNFVSWVTGKNVYNDKTLANTLARFAVYGTDVGVMWDNGIPDDPSTPDINEHQVLIAVGDTYSGANMTGDWRYNTLFRSSDDDLSNGMTIPDGEWFNGNMFGGAPLSSPTTARPIINRPSWLPNSVTLIPTAGVSLPTPDTEFGATQYVSFMSVSKWGSAGQWDTNYSAIAYSTDNGENFTIAPESVRYNSIFSGNKNFQQSAFVKGDDGNVYVYGTPNGRQGAAYVARVDADNILDVSKYEYYKKASSGWFGSSSAKWVKGNPSSASAVIGKSGGACGSTKPGNTVSEMSVQYNDYLQKYVVLYGDQFNNIVMRTSDTPEGTWSDATVLMGQQNGGIYAPMMHPWSPSTAGTGSDLYWNLSLWSDYNVMLMRTDLSLV
ncbi:hypothetical protein NGTWS1803_33210 [Mycolicibacterium cyprinidarum]|nr:hypothetical protein NGTWS1803_33210 [Mycolicibacterium sp. NGTWS1803]